MCNGKLDKLAIFASRKLNTIYIIQWIIIGNATIIYQGLGFDLLPMGLSFIVAIVVTVVSFLLARLKKG